MKPINAVAEHLTSFYWLLLPQFVLQCLYYGDYRGRVHRHGLIIGLTLELVRGLLTANAHGFTFHYEESHWSGRQVARFLKANGVPTFAWAWVEGRAYFHVPSHKAHRAERLLRKAQIPAY